MNGPTRVNVVVVGDRASGKTSLITTAAQDVFSESPVPVVQLTRFPSDFYPEPVELLVHDTSSKPEDQQHLEDTIRGADAIVLCFDAKRRNTMERLRSHWMPELQRLKPGAPVVIVCCKADTDDDAPIEQLRGVSGIHVHKLQKLSRCTVRYMLCQHLWQHASRNRTQSLYALHAVLGGSDCAVSMH